MTVRERKATGSGTGSDASPSKRDPIEAWLDVFVRMLGVKGEEAQQIRDELEDHLRTRVDDLLITGSTEPEAVRKAVAELGESADLAGRFRAAMKPRRRMLMQASLIGLAGTAVAVGVMSVAGVIAPGSSGASGGPAVATGEEQPVAASEAVAAVAAVAAGGAGGAGGAWAGQGEWAPVPASGVAPHDPALRRYDLGMLAAAGETIAQSWQAQSISVSLYRLVTPTEWDERDGEAVLQIVGNALFVSGSDETHQGVGWVLASLHEDLENQRRAARDAEQAAADERREALRALEHELARVTEEILAMQERLGQLDTDVTPFPPEGMVRPSPARDLTPEQQAQYDEWQEGQRRRMRERMRMNHELEDIAAVRSALQSQFARLRSEVYAVSDFDRIRARQHVEQMQRTHREQAQTAPQDAVRRAREAVGDDQP